tara:strand:+ start:6850 stop:7071 length:222 start_codon:yes stop_codon:yes gene_type:complete
MNEQDKTRVYQKTFNTKEGKIVIEDIKQVLLKKFLHNDLKTHALLREGGITIYNHIINSMQEKKEKPTTAIDN